MQARLKLTIIIGALYGVVGCAGNVAATNEETTEPVATMVAEDMTTDTADTYDTTQSMEYYGPARGSVEDFVINAGERIYFDSNKYELDDEDKAALQRQAQWLLAYPDVTILLSGNCDERGTRDYNLALGAKRAAAVRDYLISLGVNDNRIEVISYGKDRPLDDAHNEAAWSRNRNVWTQITGGATG